MATYIRRSHPAKRKGILEKEELELRREIKSGGNPERLGRAAEKVRLAQLKLLKGRKHYVLDDGNPDFAGFKKIHAEIADWTAKTVEEIVKVYERETSEPA